MLSFLSWAVMSSYEVLGRYVLPKMATAYDTAEFADLLWTAQVLADMGGAQEDFGQRDDLGLNLHSHDECLLDFFAAVLTARAPEITRYGLPHVGPRAKAHLAEALAMAEAIIGTGRSPRAESRRALMERATPLQRQAWEMRARVWLFKDAWRFSLQRPLNEVDRLAEAEGKPEVAA